MIVVDASAALGWTFRDEQTPALVAILPAVNVDGAIVPGLWRLEIANVLQIAVRKGRISEQFMADSLNDLEELNIWVDDETNTHAWYGTLALAFRHNLTMYDAAYLELALRRRLPIATIDRALAAAARHEAVTVLP